MIPGVEDNVELYVWLGGWVLSGRHLAGVAWRSETEALKTWSPYSYGSKPSPAGGVAMAWVSGWLWPLIYTGWGAIKLYKANQTSIHATKPKITTTLKAIFVGRGPRRLRREAERVAMQERIVELERELKL